MTRALATGFTPRTRRPPVTGFTLELDGDPEAIKRMLKAVGDVMADLHRESEQEIWVGIEPRMMYVRGLLPIRGKISFRERA